MPLVMPTTAFLVSQKPPKAVFQSVSASVSRSPELSVNWTVLATSKFCKLIGPVAPQAEVGAKANQTIARNYGQQLAFRPMKRHLLLADGSFTAALTGWTATIIDR